jgi:aspartate aminotransferase
MTTMTTSPEGRAQFAPAERLASIAVSEIMRIYSFAQQLRREGRDLVTLAAGEPDFDTPDHIKEAAARAMSAGETKYTPLDGTPQLKAAIRDKFLRDNALEYAPDEIAVSAGAKHLIFNALMATLNAGDEVVIPVPYWVSYIDIVRIAGGVPVLVPCAQENGFRVTATALERAITARTRWVILNSPSNPSGTAYSAEDYAPLLAVLLRHPHVWVMSDDIYEHIVYDGFRFATPAAIEPGLRERTLTINGVSKSYAMTGWRIGYAAGPRPLIRAMGVVQGQVTTCPSSVSQAAALAALQGPQDGVRERCKAFELRRNLVVSALNRIPGIACRLPEGAFFVFARCSDFIGRSTPDGTVLDCDAAFCEFLLHSVGVAVVPGSAFGAPGHFRLSYATSNAELERGCERIAKACDMLSDDNQRAASPRTFATTEFTP